ncbi:radical SAM protein [Pelosinus propionicus]|uniref:Radical SAM superfamily protein n=1 Tax=Pelosinus propionicus DSM 13327 TaxID=1123291 RepID=A0A1I4NAL9_9FIRM|nr:radical SAM protein [Pelosinus propionicus]SFM12416.1 Radical SAM superfamily protein [Pelosinus propionicus DSM 13327]
MRYEGVVYRPPSEAGSLLIQATIGCPHNQCTFCGMYKEKEFRIRSIAEIKEDLNQAKKVYSNTVETLFFPDGNTILMKTSDLVEIIHYAKETFPGLQRITMYGSSKYILRKSDEELLLLQNSGLTRIHSGMESGDDIVLKQICKGASAKETILAGRKVKKAGIELSEYVMLGIGGRERSRDHARNSAKALNQINPDFIRLRTFIPMSGTQLYEEYLQGTFRLLNAHDALQETRLLKS